MTGFISKFDSVPSFWGSLTSLNQYDLIAELIQNDIDQNATRTVISFKPEQLICEGNGQPVDANGWKRLCTIQGAGDITPAKQGKIGVKNHGLKAAFTIGDEICIFSDGHYVIQTLYAHGKDADPYPGTSDKPTPSLEAPTQGCRIEIEYRRKILTPRKGEQITLSGVKDATIDELFKSACRFIPEQFAGIVSPEGISRYEISLYHHSLGNARFVFSARSKQTLKDIQIFRRKCEIQGSFADLPSGFREEAARRLLPLRGRLKERVPDFYRRNQHFFVEVSWLIDGRGKPQKGTGKSRYPIGYPKGGSPEALTGHGVFFNAPIISDRERHGPAHNEETNTELQQHCEKLLVDIIAKRIIPKWGPEAMNLLIPTGKDVTIRRLLGALVKKRAIPTVDWRDAVKLLVKGNRLKEILAQGKRSRRHDTRRPRQYQFVIPTKDGKSIDDNLVIICPPREKQLHPYVAPEIVQFLADGKTDGFHKEFITFDENDVFNRLTKTKNDYFELSATLDQELAMLPIAKAYLDIIADLELDPNEEDQIKVNLLLPDIMEQAKPFNNLHTSASLPSDIPGLRLPPILHPQLVQHRLLKRKSWQRPKYNMAEFLREEGLHNADEKTRHQFWKWLIKNQQSVRKHRSKLANLSIWPDTKNKLYTLEELCEPKKPEIRKVLEQVVRRPHPQIHKSGLTTGKTKIRTGPSLEELEAWISQKLSKFRIGEAANETTKTELAQFERDLEILLKNKAISKMLRENIEFFPALAKDHFIRKRNELLRAHKNIEHLSLPERFVLENKKPPKNLDKLTEPLSKPTINMMMAAFKEDPHNHQALQMRLKEFLGLTEERDDHRQRVSKMPIIPVNGEWYVPEALAFKKREDYWGRWKIQISAKGLSQDDQKRYLAVGVTSATPTREASRAFLLWLAGHDKRIIESHMECVLLHILHMNGPISWAKDFTNNPAIPVESKDNTQLVSWKQAAAESSFIFLPDWRKFAEKIMEVDPKVSFVIDSIKGIRKPASEKYRVLNIQSLRTHIDAPIKVTADGDISDAGDGIKKKLAALRSSQLCRDFQKRLNEFDISFDQVRDDWVSQISKIDEIKTAKDVMAHYQFHNKIYKFPTDAGFDRKSKILWISKAEGIQPLHFFEAIAKQFIFKPDAPRFCYISLERVLEVEIGDQRFPSPQEKSSGEEYVGDDEDVEPEREPGEAAHGHAPFKPDPQRNIPNPTQLPSSVPPFKSRPGRHSVPQDSVKDIENQKSALEDFHIKDLKEKHYASHCQMCLGRGEKPGELAPAGSYVEWQEVRKRIIEAHHVDPKSGGGARHGGNLILLCKLHHDNFGRRLTREGVFHALNDPIVEQTITFDGNEIPGRIVEIVISDTSETICLWFTRTHAEYWLKENV